jgi:ParB family transcriptional regulator, chromosome partitioning protein
VLKKGLGRGLDALLGATNVSAVAEGVREVELSRIRANPWQPRNAFDEERLGELAQSIREHGVLQPVLLRQAGLDSYELIAGERRIRAAQLAGLERVPAMVKEYADPQMLEVALIENLQREDIGAVDAALAYRRLSSEFGMSQEEIARRVGKARTTVANTLRLLSLPEAILEGLRQGEISEGHARALLQVAPALQLSAYREIRQRGLNVREAERLTREKAPASPRRERARPAAQAAVDPEVAAIEEALQTALKTRVRLHSRSGVGRIEIEFYSQEELEGLLERIIGG